VLWLVLRKSKAAIQLATNGKTTTFYVMADVPYDSDEETKLTRDLEGLPGDAAFVIHLGNIQDASVTLCPEYAYEDASQVLKTSPAPVFMLPGENDWNNCCAGDVVDFTEYKPYDDVDNLMAVQVEHGGRSPPLRVTVDFGPKPFLFG
jgi:hypothetical protein